MEQVIPTTTPSKRRPKLHLRSFYYALAEGIIFLLALYTLINLATERFVVDGVSMSPTFETGQYLVVSRISYNFGVPQRGDIVVFHFPNDPNRDFIKRVIALPGETIEFRATEVYINGEHLFEPYIREACDPIICGDGIWQLGEDEYFVMGDNRNQSSDSRSFGALNLEYIVGEAVLRYYPFSEFEWLHQIGLLNE